AVAQVEDRRAAVAFHLAARGADRVERQRARIRRDRREPATFSELLALALFGAVETHALALRRDLLLDPAGHGVAGGLHLRGGRLDAKCVPGLERPALPAEPPAQRVVDVGDAVGDLAQAIGGIDQRLVQDRAGQLRRAIVAGHHAAHLLVDVFGAAGGADRIEARLLLRAV